MSWRDLGKTKVGTGIEGEFWVSAGPPGRRSASPVLSGKRFFSVSLPFYVDIFMVS